MAREARVRVEFGSARVAVEAVSRLSPGSVVELDVPADGDVEVYADDCLVARGRPVVVDGELCVRIREVFTPGTAREG